MSTKQPYYISHTQSIAPMIKAFAAEFDVNADPVRLAHTIEMSNNRKDNTVILDADGRGFLWGSMIRGMILNDVVGFVNIIYVDPAHRRQGIGRALIEKFKQFVEVNGGDKIIFAGTTEGSRKLGRQLGSLESEQFIIKI